VCLLQHIQTPLPLTIANAANVRYYRAFSRAIRADCCMPGLYCIRMADGAAHADKR